MRIYLEVPFEEKELAKQKGCWWDDYKQKWFIENPIHMSEYVRWMPNRLLQPTKSKPLKHEPFVNTKISKDRMKRLNQKHNKKFRR